MPGPAGLGAAALRCDGVAGKGTGTEGLEPTSHATGEACAAVVTGREQQRHEGDKHADVWLGTRTGACRPRTGAVCVRVTRYPAARPLQGEFYEALCKDVDPVAKELVCCFPEDAGLDTACFKLSYDVLVVAVGAGPVRQGCVVGCMQLGHGC